MKLHKIGLLSALSLFSFALDAQAITTSQELVTITKLISFSKDIPSGDATFAVVYDPASSQSMADLAVLKKLIAGGYKTKKHTLRFKEVSIDNISSVSAPILFMTEGLSDASQQAILDQGIANKAITVTTSVDYVKAGKCVLGVNVDDSVEIVMNSASYKASKLKFDAALKFMIKEI